MNIKLKVKSGYVDTFQTIPMVSEMGYILEPKETVDFKFWDDNEENNVELPFILQVLPTEVRLLYKDSQNQLTLVKRFSNDAWAVWNMEYLSK